MSSNQVVTFPDVEAEIINYLHAQFALIADTAVVCNLIPDQRPSRIVNVYRTGGAQVDIVRDGAQVTVDCWDGMQQNAHDLAQLARGLLRVMPFRHTTARIYRVSDTGFGPLPHPDTEQYRYTFTSRVDFRGAALPI